MSLANTRWSLGDAVAYRLEASVHMAGPFVASLSFCGLTRDARIGEVPDRVRTLIVSTAAVVNASLSRRAGLLVEAGPALIDHRFRRLDAAPSVGNYSSRRAGVLGGVRLEIEVSRRVSAELSFENTWSRYTSEAFPGGSALVKGAVKWNRQTLATLGAKIALFNLTQPASRPRLR